MSYYFSYDVKNLYQKLEAQLPADVLSKLYSEKKLHCTMLYSNDDYDKGYKTIKFGEQQSQIKGIEVWRTSDSWVLVATLNNEGLQEKHDFLVNEVKATPDFSFKPHITLQKEDKEENIIDMSEVKYLIGSKVELIGFRCIPIRKTVDSKLKM
jgi:2'-5' RNA ligase